MRALLMFGLVVWLAGCDGNAAPKFGSSGLPANCRAYVQVAVDSYRSRQYSADDTMAGLERNCGAGGQLWR